MSLFLIAALPFLGAVFPALLIRAGRNASSWAAGLVTLLALTGVMLHAPAVMRGEVVQARARLRAAEALMGRGAVDPGAFDEAKAEARRFLRRYKRSPRREEMQTLVGGT